MKTTYYSEAASCFGHGMRVKGGSFESELPALEVLHHLTDPKAQP